MLLVLPLVGRAEPLDEECPPYRPPTRFEELKLTFGELSSEAFEAKVAALRSQTHDVIGTSDAIHAALVTADRLQAEALRKREDLIVEEHLPRIAFSGVVLDVTGHSRLEPLLWVPGWSLEAKPGLKVPYAVMLRTPFASQTEDWFERFAYFLKDPEWTVAPLSGDGNFYMMLTRRQATKLATMPEVRWVGLMEPLYKVGVGLFGTGCFAERPKDLQRIAEFFSANAQRRTTVEVSLGAITPGITKLLASLGADGQLIEGSSITLQTTLGAVRELARRPEVLAINDASGVPEPD